MNTTKLWLGFKTTRVLVFAISTVLAMGLAVIFAILLGRGWRFYSSAQRSILVIILVIDGFSTILLYLMIIVRFRLWLDGARVLSLVVFQAGATVTFSIARSSLPCANLGSTQVCKILSTTAVFGGWSLSVLLLLHAFCLAVMSHVPRPSTLGSESTSSPSGNVHKSGQSSTFPVASPPSYKALTIASDKESCKDDKRLSFLSNSGSQTSWNGSQVISPPARSISLASRSTISVTQYGVYRPDTPQVALSPSTSSTFSSAHASHFDGMTPLQLPPPYGYFPDPPTSLSPQKDRPPPFLPNPFLELSSRSGTPASVTSFRSDGLPYTSPRMQQRSQTSPIPRVLLAGGWSAPSPAQYSDPQNFLTVESGEKPVSPAPGPELVFRWLRDNSTPLNLRAGIEMRDTRESLQSPDQMSVVSRSASIQLPSIDRNESSLSVPRSPSPCNLPVHMLLPASPKALTLPAHPRLYPVNLRGPQRFHEVRRVESSPDVRQGGPFTIEKQGHLLATSKQEAARLPVAPGYAGQVRFIST